METERDILVIANGSIFLPGLPIHQMNHQYFIVACM